MSLLAILVLSAVAVVGLMLLLSIFTSPSLDAADKSVFVNRRMRLFLVALRLVIGWHLLIEGVDKLRNPNWTSQPYLHAAVGPLGPYFRNVADREFLSQFDVEKDQKELPEALEASWQRWFDVFKNETLKTAVEKQKENLKGEIKHLTKNKAALTARNTKRDELFTRTSFTFAGASIGHPILATIVNVPPQRFPSVDERLAALNKKLDALDSAEERAEKKLNEAKKKTLKWMWTKQDISKPSPYMDRADKMSAPERVAFYHQLIDEVEALAKSGNAALSDRDQKKVNDKWGEAQEVYRSLKTDLAVQTVNMQKSVASVIEEPVLKRLKLPPVPPKPFSFTGDELNWANLLIPWVLTVIGGCLIVGLFSRLNCLAAALLLILFFLPMPPLPGWPTNPRAEGHYLYINKNIVEMFALLVLATTRSGRWLGVDALIGLVLGRFRRKPAEA